MAKSYNQKIKLLFLMELLQERTDYEHTISMKEILEEMEKNGIAAARKSIYSDIETLKDYGLSIEYRKEKPEGYYLVDREFELAELKLLVDAVQSSRFITEKKSRTLIKKLEGLASKYEAAYLQRQVYVADRVKTMNESIYYNVDRIHSAISNDSKISFEYTQWVYQTEVCLKSKGKVYKISPWALSWTDDNYYLIGYDSEQEMIKHFRVDKMLKINMLNEKREGKKQYGQMDTAVYSKNMFGMFAGEEKNLGIRIPEHLLGVFVDRFGKDISVRKEEKGYYIIRVKAVVSEPFFGWLTGLGKDVIIRAPKDTSQKYKEFLQNIIREYEK